MLEAEDTNKHDEHAVAVMKDGMWAGARKHGPSVNSRPGLY